MADPETDRRDVNEAEEAFRGFVVAGRDTPGVFELVEAAFDQITQAIRHWCKVSDEAAFCLIQRPYISKTLLTRRISPRGSP